MKASSLWTVALGAALFGCYAAGADAKGSPLPAHAAGATAVQGAAPPVLGAGGQQPHATAPAPTNPAPANPAPANPAPANPAPVNPAPANPAPANPAPANPVPSAGTPAERTDAGSPSAPQASSTIIVDEIPGRVLHLDAAQNTIAEITNLFMPYDAAYRASDKTYLIGLIQDRAVATVTATGEIKSQVQVGGYPNSVDLLPDGNFLVTGWDESIPGFVREFDAAGKAVWEINDLKWPWKAQRLANGNTLIADAGQNRVFEVQPDKSVVWEVKDLGPPNPMTFDLLGPVYVQRLANGNTLVSIRGLDKVVELDAAGKTVWEIGDEVIVKPYSAVRLDNGHTLICDGGHARVIEVDEQKKIVWEKGGFLYVAKAHRVR